MAIVQPTNKSVQSYNGLHLYHGDISNCSMRVRMTLVEKSLDWTSHHLDLRKKENISEDYFGINPNGLVPTLIHDGIVHIESNEIIDYLDRTFPEPPLRVASKDAEMLEWLSLAGSIHLPAIKPYVYATKIQKKVKKTAEEQTRYEALQKDEDLKDFHSRHAGNAAFREEDLVRSKAILADCFGKLDAALVGNDWIMGDRFTLADISWIPVFFVLSGCGYPFGEFRSIARWAASFNDRRSYREGILDWCPDFSKV